MGRVREDLGRWLWGQPYLLLSLTALFWSGNLVLGRAVAASLPPFTLAALRWTGALCIASPFAFGPLRKDAAVIRKSLPQFALLAVTGVAINNALAYLGLHYTDATNALVLQSASPLLIALWAFLLYRDRLTGQQIIGLVLSFLGVALVLSRGAPLSLLQLQPNLGDLFVMIAIVSYALYSALLRKRPQVHAMSFIAVIFFIGALLLWPVAAFELTHGATFPLNANSLFSVLYVAIFPSLIAFICFNRGVELIGPNRAGPFFHLMPPLGVVLAMIFLGERPALYHAGGFLLILGGVALASMSPRKRIG